jgi:hypothetical protein
MATRAKFARLAHYLRELSEASHIFLQNGLWRMSASLASPRNTAWRMSASLILSYYKINFGSICLRFIFKLTLDIKRFDV